MRSEYFLAQSDELVVGNNTGCGPSGSSALEFGFQLESVVYIHAVGCMYTPFRLAQISNMAQPAGT